MKILDRYILKELAVPFLFGIAAFTSILVAGDALLRLTKLVAEEGATFWEAGLVFLYSLPRYLVLTFPMSTLLAVLLSLGRLSADSEIVAIKAGGYSLYRLLAPVAAFGLMASLASIALDEMVVPPANRAGEALLLRISASERARAQRYVLIPQIEDGVLRRLIYADHFDPPRKLMQGVTMLEYKGGQPSVLIAGRVAVWEGSRWTFRDGFTQTVRPDGRTITIPFARQRVEFASSPQEIVRSQRKPEQMTFQELRAEIEDLVHKGVDVAVLRVRLQHKLSIPFASLVFVLIGFPLAIRSHRTSSSAGLSISIALILVYYLIWHYLTVVADRGLLPPIWAAWLPNLVGAAIGIALLVRVSK